jgi:ABC-type uncharacterized transport system permease subunit
VNALRALAGPAIAGAAVAAAMLLVLLGLTLAGHAPGAVAATWFHGAAGTGVRLALSLQEACPLLLTGLAVALAFRCGVLNIGGEGQFLVGAAALVALATRWALPGPGWLALPLALRLAAAAGAGWALLAGGLERWRGVPLVLSTILLNFVALFLVSGLVEGPLRDPATSAPQTALVGEAFHLPLLVAGTRLHLGAPLALLLAGGLWLVLGRTTLGFELRAAGQGPLAARLAGMPVADRQLLALGASGALAGLAGGIQVAGVTWFLSGTPTSYGYAGIAAALLGRLHPLGVVLAAVLLGMLDTGGRALEKQLAIPHDLGDVAKGLAVLAVLVAGAWLARSRLAPLRAGGADGGQ